MLQAQDLVDCRAARFGWIQHTEAYFAAQFGEDAFSPGMVVAAFFVERPEECVAIRPTVVNAHASFGAIRASQAVAVPDKLVQKSPAFRVRSDLLEVDQVETTELAQTAPKQRENGSIIIGGIDHGVAIVAERLRRES